MKKKKVFVGLSGGVDSSVAALLLLREGRDVVGVHLRTVNLDGCGEREAEDARRVAERLDIPFYVWDFEEEYRAEVLHGLVEGYTRGETPNPDVACNRAIKFGVFLRRALAAGADAVATGHYARLVQSADGVLRLAQSRDAEKDQTYFLWTLGPAELEHCLFPIGEYTKSEVRVIAREAGLPTAEKKDSQGICFLGKVKLVEFLRERIGERQGPVVMRGGEVIGTHRGAEFVTIGQRHFGFAPSAEFLKRRESREGGAWYIAAKDTGTNTITVAEGGDNPALYAARCELREARSDDRVRERAASASGLVCLVRLRYREPLARATLHLTLDRWLMEFREPHRATARGQSAVWYGENGEVLGGGIVDCVA